MYIHDINLLGQLRETVYKWAQEHVAPRAAQVDRDNQFPNELWPKMGEMGFLGVTAPGTSIE